VFSCPDSLRCVAAKTLNKIVRLRQRRKKGSSAKHGYTVQATLYGVPVPQVLRMKDPRQAVNFTEIGLYLSWLNLLWLLPTLPSPYPLSHLLWASTAEHRENLPYEMVCNQTSNSWGDYASARIKMRHKPTLSIYIQFATDT